MAIRKVEAEVECDGCGGPFTVDLDPADTLDDGRVSILDYIEDIVNGLPWCSIQGEHWLCRRCTAKVDEAFEDGESPTHEQVAAALNKAAGV